MSDLPRMKPFPLVELGPRVEWDTQCTAITASGMRCSFRGRLKDGDRRCAKHARPEPDENGADQ